MSNKARAIALSLAFAGSLVASDSKADLPCPSDLDGNRVVDTADLSLILLNFGACAGCTGDLDGGGTVDTGDLSLLLLEFGSCPSWYTVIQQSPDPAVVYDSDLRAKITATGLPWRVRDNGTGIEMLLIPAGSFDMGCSLAWSGWACASAEKPVHRVILTQPWYMGRHEVTQSQWTSIMGNNPSELVCANCPVASVSWDDLQSFLAAAGLRLPSEAEWEYAYRAGTQTAFHGWPGKPAGTGNDEELGNIAWFRGNSYRQTRPVGGKQANGFGMHDMAGTVSEWVNDWWGLYPSGTQTDPTGPGNGTRRVFRGGNYDQYAQWCRASDRYGNPPDTKSEGLGFRVARNP